MDKIFLRALADLRGALLVWTHPLPGGPNFLVIFMQFSANAR